MVRSQFRKLLAAALGLAIVAPAAACDPDLHITRRDPDAGAVEAGTSVSPTETPPEGDAGARDAASQSSDAEPTEGGPPAHKVDGVNDFTADETFETSSAANGYTAYFTYDDKILLFGMKGGDIGAGASPRKWIFVYLGAPDVKGTTTGIDYGGEQQPRLPFEAKYHLRLKTDLSYLNAQVWNGTSWVDAAPDGLVPDAERKGDFLEFLVSREKIGNPTKLRVHINMIIEGNGEDWSYAAVPRDSFKDGKNPDYTKYFEFDLGAPQQPAATYAPLPAP